MAFVKKLFIQNFKCYEKAEFVFDENLNIIVGDNEEGKSTILEALHLVLSGMLNGRILRAENISEYLFNYSIKKKYLDSLKSSENQAEKQSPPEIIIEAYLSGNDPVVQENFGDENHEYKGDAGIFYKIRFNDDYKSDYEEFIKSGDCSSLPVEYYKIEWRSFARRPMSSKKTPIKSVMIDSASNRYLNGADIYLSKIIRDGLADQEIVELSQAYRLIKDDFSKKNIVEKINNKIASSLEVLEDDSDKRKLNISVDLSNKNIWEYFLMTYINDIPFHQIGKGEQCIIKTNIALMQDAAINANAILLEEPENHLSHSNLNLLINLIENKSDNKQLFITTHSNFVANKLNLSKIIFLSKRTPTYFSDLNSDDVEYFKKIPGYDTLRVVLSKRALLVEGPSDELVVQRAFKDLYGKLPIECGIDVISVRGLSFKRFLNIAVLTKKNVAVITDNDHDFAIKITNKYKDYTNESNVRIFADNRNDLNTLEPQVVDANKENLTSFQKIVGLKGDCSFNEVVEYMKDNKSDWALNIFDSETSITYPEYIMNAIKWIYGEK